MFPYIDTVEKYTCGEKNFTLTDYRCCDTLEFMKHCPMH